MFVVGLFGDFFDKVVVFKGFEEEFLIQFVVDGKFCFVEEVEVYFCFFEGGFYVFVEFVDDFFWVFFFFECVECYWCFVFVCFVDEENFFVFQVEIVYEDVSWQVCFSQMFSVNWFVSVR